jgi:hypothetical protein
VSCAEFIADLIWLITPDLVLEDMVFATVNTKSIDVVNSSGVFVLLAILFEAEEAWKRFTKFADAGNIQTNRLGQVLAVEIVALRIEEALDPKIEMLLEQIKLEPMSNSP